MAQAQSPTITTLQAGRALAALAVVALHAELSVGQIVDPLPPALRGLLEHGHLGVEFFFVLSGYIIYHTCHERAGRPGSFAAFAETRMTRIFIPYLPVGAALALAYMVTPGAGPDDYAWSGFTTLTLAPVGRSALSVAWTLQHEVLFYAIAGILLHFRKLIPGMIAWSLCIIASAATGIGADWLGLKPINLDFGLGVFAAWLVASGRWRDSALPAAAGTALVLAYFLGAGQVGELAFAAGVAVLLVPLVHAEAKGKLRASATLILLGNASYAIYLVHNPLLSVIARAAAAVGLDWSAAFVIGCAASVAAGIAYHFGFEKPALALSRRLGAQARRAPAAQTARPRKSLFTSANERSRSESVPSGSGHSIPIAGSSSLIPPSASGV
jgi:peptidoglycan/LPS O-acetylase OafA/YrhL